MPPDFVTDPPPGESPTEGLETQAPQLPYVPSTFGERFGSSVGQATTWLSDQIDKFATENGGVPSSPYDPYGLVQARPEDIGAPDARIGRDQLRKEFPGVEGIDQDLPRTVVQDMQREQQSARDRADIQARWPGGMGHAIEGFGADLAGSFLDPVGDAAFMVPVVGEARYAEWLARAGEASGAAGRAGLTFGVGALRGGVGGGLLSGAEALTDPDATLGQVATDTLQTALLGGIFHTGFSFRSDVLGRRFLDSPEGEIAAADANVHDNAVRAAAAQMADGQPIEVRPVFDAARMSRQQLLGTTAIGRVAPQAPYLDDAVARATGRPSEQAMADADLAAEAKANPPDKVIAAQTAEAEGMIEQLRTAGLLTPEDEAALQLHDQLAAPARPTETPPQAQQRAAELFPAPGATLSPEEEAWAHTAFLGPALADLEATKRLPADNSLFRTMRELGGVRTKDGEGQTYTAGPDIGDAVAGLGRASRGLVRNGEGALSPELMAQALADRGWFGANPGDPSVAFEQAFNREASGAKVYHPEDTRPALAARKFEIENELSRAGVEIREEPQASAEKLARYRVLQSRDSDLDRLKQRAAELGIAHAPTATREELHADIAEREAVMAEAGEKEAERYERIVDERLTPDDRARLAADAGRYLEPLAAEAEGAAVPEGRGEGPEGPAAAGRAGEAPGGGAEPAATGTVPGEGEAPRERVVLGGESAEQGLFPGTEASARQAMAAREAQGGLRAVAAQAGAGPLFEAPDETQDIPFQRAPFYSALDRTIERNPQRQASADQWLSTLRNAPGVKREELEWAGLEDWLKLFGDEPVSKEAVQAFVRGNGVKVEEKLLGKPPLDQSSPYYGRQVARVLEAAQDPVLELENDGDAYRELMHSHPELVDDENWARHVVDSVAPGWERGTQYGDWVLPGGEDYHELLLTLPDVANPPATHWDTPGVMAHVRFDTREAPDGKRVLFVEEVQSDWHQKGREQGYGQKASQAEIDEAAKRATDAAVVNNRGIAELRKAIDDPALAPFRDGAWSRAGIKQGYPVADLSAFHVRQLADFLQDEARLAIGRRPEGQRVPLPPEVAAAADRVSELHRETARNELAWTEAQQAHQRALGLTGIPDAPFKTSWPTLVMKRMIVWAADHGYDRVAWTTGAQQAARYDLSKHVDYLSARRAPDGRFDVRTNEAAANALAGHGAGEHLNDYATGYSTVRMTPQQLTEAFGADLGGRIQERATEPHEFPAVFDGLDLQVGGEGMRAFYDRNLVNMTNDIIKRYGERVRNIDLHSPEREAIRAARPQRETAGQIGIQPGFDISPKMREAVQEGLPLFQRLLDAARRTEPEEVKARPLAEGEGAERVARAEEVGRRIAPGATIQPFAEMRSGEEPVHGAYFPQTNEGLRHVIAWSLQGPDEVNTVKHEAFHFLKRAGYVSPEENATLEEAAQKKGWLGLYDIASRYPDLSPEKQTEEAIAEHLANWQKGLAWVPQAVRPIFQKIVAGLGQVGDFVRRTFGMNATAEDVLRRIESGEVGARTPGAETGRDVAFQRGAEGLTPEEVEALAKERARLTLMRDTIKRKALLQRVADVRQAGLTLSHGIDAQVRGISEAVPGARDSTAGQQLSRQNQFMGRLISNLERTPGAMTAWRGRTETANWVRELAELNKEHGQPGMTKSPMALKIAEAVHDAQDLARYILNQSGAWIGDYDGYVARTQHNAVAIHNAGYERWKTDTLAGIDKAKTFGDLHPLEQEEFMRSMWDALSTGVHMSGEHGINPKAEAFPGAYNVARKLSSERVLHWRDADAWKLYQEQYGDPVIERGIVSSLTRAGRDAALMERWGSNPAATFEALTREIRQTYRHDHEALAKFDASMPRLREEFAHLTGQATIPANSLAAKIRGSVTALQDITKLGNVVLAHLSAAATKPFQLQYHGIGRWQAYTSVLRNLVEDKSPEGQRILENLRANATGQTQDIMHGYEPVDGVPGQIAALRAFSMRLGGLPWMMGRQKAGAQWELASFLGQSLGKPFEELEPRTQRGLTIYGITPAEWDALRNAPDHDRDATGQTYLTPAAAQRADVDPLAGNRMIRARDAEDAERIRGELRDRLGMKLAAYYADSADRSTITPGIPERAFWTQHAGRTWGPMVGQYKTWAMAAVRQMWGQAIHGSSRGEAVKSLAELVAVGTAIGYARLAITSAFQGETPELFGDDPKHNATLMLKAMVSGGGLGIWGDYLMGQYSRPGESGLDRAKDFALNLMGPAFSDAAQLYGLGEEAASAAFSDDPGHVLGKTGGEMERFITSHLPFVNAFYLHLLSHWLILDRLNDMADPGYLQRHQDAIKARTGQDFWLPPTGYLGAEAA